MTSSWIENGTAGENITAPAFCYIDPGDAKVYIASAATTDHPATCVVFANAVTDGDCQVLYGTSVFDWEIGLNVGDEGYLSADTPGGVTGTAPTNAQPLGRQIEGGRFFVDIKPFKTRPYRVYSAYLSQASTNAPEAIVLENTLGEITYTRVSEGVYNIESSGLFTSRKTFHPYSSFFLGGEDDDIAFTMYFWDDASHIRLETRTLVGAGALVEMQSEIYIEIRVYP